ncbi:MAG: hypothetical protein KVP17_001571 [Porospora cf. gigantea B]|uniref:uncharacterized protein n=1 Tax=Porospora cf. gigantea B TaxID=2853592 RepID=UPI003571D298|nr:MAG: hypothetical protein KVP17_001571 [Porospora cf. gigantea B]
MDFSLERLLNVLGEDTDPVDTERQQWLASFQKCPTIGILCMDLLNIVTTSSNVGNLSVASSIVEFSCRSLRDVFRRIACDLATPDSELYELSKTQLGSILAHFGGCSLRAVARLDIIVTHLRKSSFESKDYLNLIEATLCFRLCLGEGLSQLVIAHFKVVRAFRFRYVDWLLKVASGKDHEVPEKYQAEVLSQDIIDAAVELMVFFADKPQLLPSISLSLTTVAEHYKLFMVPSLTEVFEKRCAALATLCCQASHLSQDDTESRHTLVRPFKIFARHMMYPWKVVLTMMASLDRYAPMEYEAQQSFLQACVNQCKHQTRLLCILYFHDRSLELQEFDRELIELIVRNVEMVTAYLKKVIHDASQVKMSFSEAIKDPEAFFHAAVRSAYVSSHLMCQFHAVFWTAGVSETLHNLKRTAASMSNKEWQLTHGVDHLDVEVPNEDDNFWSSSRHLVPEDFRYRREYSLKVLYNLFSLIHDVKTNFSTNVTSFMIANHLVPLDASSFSPHPRYQYELAIMSCIANLYRLKNAENAKRKLGSIALPAAERLLSAIRTYHDQHASSTLTFEGIVPAALSMAAIILPATSTTLDTICDEQFAWMNFHRGLNQAWDRDTCLENDMMRMLMDSRVRYVTDVLGHVQYQAEQGYFVDIPGSETIFQHVWCRLWITVGDACIPVMYRHLNAHAKEHLGAARNAVRQTLRVFAGNLDDGHLFLTADKILAAFELCLKWVQSESPSNVPKSVQCEWRRTECLLHALSAVVSALGEHTNHEKALALVDLTLDFAGATHHRCLRRSAYFVLSVMAPQMNNYLCNSRMYERGLEIFKKGWHLTLQSLHEPQSDDLYPFTCMEDHIGAVCTLKLSNCLEGLMVSELPAATLVSLCDEMCSDLLPSMLKEIEGVLHPILNVDDLSADPHDYVMDSTGLDMFRFLARPGVGLSARSITILPCSIGSALSALYAALFIVETEYKETYTERFLHFLDAMADSLLSACEKILCRISGVQDEDEYVSLVHRAGFTIVLLSMFLCTVVPPYYRSKHGLVRAVGVAETPLWLRSQLYSIVEQLHVLTPGLTTVGVPSLGSWPSLEPPKKTQLASIQGEQLELLRTRFVAIAVKANHVCKVLFEQSNVCSFNSPVVHLAYLALGLAFRWICLTPISLPGPQLTQEWYEYAREMAGKYPRFRDPFNNLSFALLTVSGLHAFLDTSLHHQIPVLEDALITAASNVNAELQCVALDPTDDNVAAFRLFSMRFFKMQVWPGAMKLFIHTVMERPEPAEKLVAHLADAALFKLTTECDTEQRTPLRAVECHSPLQSLLCQMCRCTHAQKQQKYKACEITFLLLLMLCALEEHPTHAVVIAVLQAPAGGATGGISRLQLIVRLALAISACRCQFCVKLSTDLLLLTLRLSQPSALFATVEMLVEVPPTSRDTIESDCQALALAKRDSRAAVRKFIKLLWGHMRRNTNV